MARKIRGICMIAAGALMVFSGTGLYAMHDYQDELAGRNAEILLMEYRNRAIEEPEIAVESLVGADSWETPVLEEVQEEMPVGEYAG